MVGASRSAAAATVTLEDIVKSVRNVPVAPEILPKLQSKLRDIDTDVADLAALIKLDSGLASSVLKVSNSAYYARSANITSIEEAVTLIGYQETLRLVARCSYATVMKGSLDAYGIPGEQLWQEAVLAAFAMEQLCGLVCIESSEGYVAGLLHGVGMVAINDFLHRHGRARRSAPVESTSELVRWELDMIGYHHGQVGAAMMRQWHIPARIGTAVEHQFDSKIRPEEPLLHCLLPLAVSIAVAVAHHADDEVELQPVFDFARIERTGLQSEQLIEVATEVRQDWVQTRRFLV